MSKFMQYAVTASQEALDDAGWHPKNEEEREMSVSPTTYEALWAKV